MSTVEVAGGREAAQFRCPCCGSSWCRCRVCGARYALDETTACMRRDHVEPATLYCRCGARVTAHAVETPSGRVVALLCNTRRAGGGLIGRLRTRGLGRARLEWFIHVAARRAQTVRGKKGRDRAHSGI
jgi:hypothetical protein